MPIFRTRKITHANIESGNYQFEQIYNIITSHFSTITREKFDKMIHQIRTPGLQEFITTLYVVENARMDPRGIAFVLDFPKEQFTYLDFIAVPPSTTSSGVGGALYERIREESFFKKSIGIFMECLPDDPSLCKDQSILPQNRARLAFYEKYGARPILGTAYETPVKEGDDCPPYLVYDDLGTNKPLSRSQLKKIIRIILESKYSDYCPKSYIDRVVASVVDSPVRLREYRYKKQDKIFLSFPLKEKIGLIFNDRHIIHHVKEVGYVESPVRVKNILHEIEKLNAFDHISSRHFPDKYILQIHQKDFVTYFSKVAMQIPENKSIYPYVFPVRNAARPPKEFAVKAGYYCIDTFTPLNKNAYLASREAVNCTLTGAQLLLEGFHSAYALVRPPGHHAESGVYGGFCYFNNAAIAANYLTGYGRVAILDLDYHHGNGQQEIFYNRNDVLTVSIHGHPSFAYPYFSGFEDETGTGKGSGYNINFPLQEKINGKEYRKHLKNALRAINQFNPDFVVICIGYDTAKGDPTGTWSLDKDDFHENGQMIGTLNYPILFVQEGGYKNKTIGINARYFFHGYLSGRFNNARR